jgi:hypothetical protein
VNHFSAWHYLPPPPPPQTHCKYTQMSIVQCTCTVICNCAGHAFLLFLACMQPCSKRHSCPWECSPSRREYWMTYRGPRLSRSGMIWIPPPPPLHQSVSSIGDIQQRLRKRDNLLTREGGERAEGVGGGAIAWSCINNLILSALDSILKLNKQSGGVSVYIYGLF